jgi:malate permease and related proteins
MISNALVTITSIILIIGVGIFLSWKNWVSPESAKAFPLIIVNVTMPSSIIFSLSSELSKEQLIKSWLPLLIVFLTLPVTFFLGKLFAWIFRIPQSRRGIFNVIFAFSNSVFIGFPVAQALFGDPGMPYAVFYYLANTTFFWTLGYYSIQKDADAINGTGSMKITIRDIMAKLVTAPFVTVILMFSVIFSGLKLPDIIIVTTKYLSGITSPLSLIFMGCLIFKMGRTCLSYQKDILPIIAGRYIIAPGVCFALSMLLAMLLSPQTSIQQRNLMRDVFTVQAGLPAMATASIASEICGADTEYATKGFFWTMIVSPVIIPIYMFLFQHL